ncbi:MAG: hypothetical protein AAGF11_30650 [Myxococcota bacterium]
MLRARRLALAAVLAILGPGLGSGCTTSTELRRIRTPAGVTLAYQLEAGQGYEGNLRVGNTRAIEGLDKPLSQTATCDVTMAILGTTPEGTEVRATFGSVELDWDLPPSATYSTNELLELAGSRLRGMQVSFLVRPDGRIQALPRPPDDAPPELREVIETLLLGLEAFFVPLPPTALSRNEPWTAQLEHETADGLRLALDQTLRIESSYQHRSQDVTLRRLAVEQERREQRVGEAGPLTVERQARAVLLFAGDGYPVELDREIQEFDPVDGMVFRKVRAQWTRTRGLTPELIAPPDSGDVQVIRDPCNPDYVGPEACEDDEPSPANATAEDPAAEPDDAPARDGTPALSDEAPPTTKTEDTDETNDGPAPSRAPQDRENGEDPSPAAPAPDAAASNASAG